MKIKTRLDKKGCVALRDKTIIVFGWSATGARLKFMRMLSPEAHMQNVENMKCKV